MIQRLATGGWAMVGLFILLLLSLYVLGNVAEDVERFGRLYVPLLVLNAAGIAFIGLLIGINTWNLVRQFRQREAGARLTARLVAMFVVLALVPVTIVYTFSVQFIRGGIDSWFDLEIEAAMEDSLDLATKSLHQQTRTLEHMTQRMADDLYGASDASAVRILEWIQAESGAEEVMLLSTEGDTLISRGPDWRIPLAGPPARNIIERVAEGGSYAGLDPTAGAGLHVRAVVPVASARADEPMRILQVVYPVPEELGTLATGVQDTVGRYRELVFLREPLKTSYVLTLSLALLLSVLTAVWAAFFSARRLMLPIHNLAEGTRAVARGNYATRLPPSGRDELGFLVQSFNEMTRRLARARDQARLSRLEVDSQRAYLEAVLERVSTGVLTTDAEGTLRTANRAAASILGLDLATHAGRPLAELAGNHPPLGQFLQAVMPHIRQGAGEWHEEFELPGAHDRQIIVCRGARLPDQQERTAGWVIVFDDITALARAQREAAWSEVARRLAHEIRNPLTPIQLSAERLRHKFLERLPPADAEILDRSTWTIIQQVEALKAMVRAFADYAATPAVDFAQVDLNALLHEVAELYRGRNDQASVEVDAAPDLPAIHADRARLRQVLHNLIKNALEAWPIEAPRHVVLSTRLVADEQPPMVELSVRDNGPGIAAELVERLFEPYTTGSKHGSGLGLAIVKKIIDEHGGSVLAENPSGGGARIVVRLPLIHQSRAETTHEQ